MHLRLATVQLDFVPNAAAATSAHWIPSEPLYWRLDSTPPASASLHELGVHATPLKRIREAVSKSVLSQQRSRLQQILNFLEEQKVDVAVFPEYSLIPDPETVDILANYSKSFAIVAGLGLPRGYAGALELVCDEPVNGQTNCAGVFSDGRCTMVTKKHAAAGEKTVAGTGGRVVAVKGRDGKAINLAVFICKDYLMEGESFEGMDEFDAVAIPALTEQTEDFLKRTARGVPRIFANASSAGNSTVLATSVTGTYATHSGAKPLPTGTEGVIAVDWHGAVQKPTDMRQLDNRVARRSAILNQASDRDASDIAGKLYAMPVDYTPDAGDDDELSRWHSYLSSRKDLSVLQDAIGQFSSASVDGLLDGEMHDLLRTHLDLRATQSIGAQRLGEFKRIYKSIAEQMERVDPQGPSWTALYEALPQYAEGAGSLSTPASASGPAARSANVVCHFSLGLGMFDSDDAEATTPEQLHVLNTFARTAPAGSQIVFRLRTDPEPATGQVRALYSISFCGPSDEVDFFKNLERIARTVYVRGWSLYSGKFEHIGGHVVQLSPAQELQASAPANLGLLVDMLRAHGGDACLDVAARVNGADKSEAKAGIDLAVRLTTPEPNPALETFVGSVLFKGQSITVTELVPDADPAWASTNVSDALGLLHPPAGRIESRGIGRRRSLEIAIRDIPALTSGVSIGLAKHHTAYLDKQIDVRLPEASRTLHTYVIGRTGSGKTNTLKNIVRHDLGRTSPTVLIDPHGDLFDYATRHGMTGAGCVALDFSRDEVPSVNPLYLDAESMDDILLNIDDVVQQMIQSTNHEFAGPRFADLASLAMETLVVTSDEDDGDYATIVDVPRLFEDEKFRQAKVKRLGDLGRVDLAQRWRAHGSMLPSEQSNVGQWFASKFGPFRTSPALRAAVSGRPTISLRKLLAQGTSILVRIPVAVISANASNFLGSLLVDRLTRLTMTSSFMGFDEPASLIVDEFQNYAGMSFVRLIPEARKFNLGITLANQTLNQLETFSLFQGTRVSDLPRIILGNVGCLIVQPVGRKDARDIAPELEVPVEQVAKVGRHTAVMVMTVDGARTDAFTVSLKDANANPGLSEAATESAIAAALDQAKTMVTVPKIDRTIVPKESSVSDDTGPLFSANPFGSSTVSPSPDPIDSTIWTSAIADVDAVTEDGNDPDLGSAVPDPKDETPLSGADQSTHDLPATLPVTEE